MRGIIHRRKSAIMRVSGVTQGDAFITAHGSREMPIWGDVFRAPQRDAPLVKLWVHNLAQYIESLQQR